MSLNEDNLKTYLENAWDEDNAASPGAITTDQLLLNQCNKLLLRLLRMDPRWISGLTKQFTGVYECRLSHPTKEDGLTELTRLLLAYPGAHQPANVTTDAFTTVANWTVLQGTFTAVSGEGRATGATGGTWVKRAFAPFDGTILEVTVHSDAMGNDESIGFGFAANTNVLGRIYGDIHTFRLNGATNEDLGIPTVDNTSYTLKLVLDMTNHAYDAYINGVLVKAAKAMVYAGTPNYVWLQNFYSYAYFDNYNVKDLPYIDLDRAAFSIGEPRYLGVDGEGNHVWTLTFTATRFE